MWNFDAPRAMFMVPCVSYCNTHFDTVLCSVTVWHSVTRVLHSVTLWGWKKRITEAVSVWTSEQHKCHQSSCDPPLSPQIASSSLPSPSMLFIKTFFLSSSSSASKLPVELCCCGVPIDPPASVVIFQAIAFNIQSWYPDVPTFLPPFPDKGLYLRTWTPSSIQGTSRNVILKWSIELNHNFCVAARDVPKLSDNTLSH